MIVQAKEQDQQFEVLCSYCEVYNEVIYDLLVTNSAPLDLRCILPALVPIAALVGQQCCCTINLHHMQQSCHMSDTTQG